VLSLYERALARLDRAARLAIIACTAAMIVVVSVQVALRYLLNTSIDWSDEVSRLLFVWCMFLAIPLGIREGSHVGVELLVTHFPAHVRRGIARFTTAAAIGLMAIVLYETAIVSWDTWDELLPTLDMSANWFLVPVAVSAAHSILHLVQLLWRDPVRTIVAMNE
jgi:TRAP-type C4-dicarboxylate transport system permease small subunit